MLTVSWTLGEIVATAVNLLTTGGAAAVRKASPTQDARCIRETGLPVSWSGRLVISLKHDLRWF